MQNFKTPVIAGVIALAAVIVTIIVVTSSGGNAGLYVSAVSGDVSVSNSSDGATVPMEAESFLKSGDVITVNAGGSCKLTYKCKDGTEKNYAVLEPVTQVFVTGEFDGKSDSEMYLNRGSVIVTAMEEDKHNIIVRTENSSITTGGATVRVAFAVGEDNTTSVASFGGNSEIQMYDSMGNTVYRTSEEKNEYLAGGRCGQVVSGKGGNPPKISYLNVYTELGEYGKDTLRELLNISSESTLAFTPADIKAAFDAAADTESALEEATESTTASQTEVTFSEISIETEITETTTEQITSTAPPVTTVQTTTSTYVTTTAAPVTSTTAAPTDTAAPVTTTEEDLIGDEPAGSESGNEENLIDVYIMIEDEIIYRSVPYGGSAEKPADPYVEGKRFIGWDGSFDNITEECTIYAMFEDIEGGTVSETPSDVTYYTVTVNINGQLTEQQVQEGGAALLPAVNIAGYDFIGWDKPGTDIRQNETITAILVPSAGTSVSYTVTFVIDGMSYPVSVQAGENAVPPIIPTINSAGQNFLGWDNDITSINSDRTVNAMFGS